MSHSITQEDDIEKFTFVWYSFLSFYFVLDKQNYARYGSFYVTILLNIGVTYPELKALLAEKGISVQDQDRYSLRTLADQRGQRTINKDAKTADLFISQYLLNLTPQLIISRKRSYL